MIKLSEINAGDIVNARYEDKVNTGSVMDVDREERKVLVAHGDQEFWYSNDDLSAVPLTIGTLEALGFSRATNPELDAGGTAYVKGPFIVRYHNNNTGKMLLTYRDEFREVDSDISVHLFQNHYRSMTNMQIAMA